MSHTKDDEGIQYYSTARKGCEYYSKKKKRSDKENIQIHSPSNDAHTPERGGVAKERTRNRARGGDNRSRGACKRGGAAADVHRHDGCAR